MILDASAVIAILRNEPEADAFAHAIEQAQECSISTANYLEAAIVLDSARDPVVSRKFDALVEAIPLQVHPVTERQAKIAREAFRDFGKGSGHPACLNFGDCFAYALANDTGAPLLFKGNDFPQTDVERA